MTLISVYEAAVASGDICDDPLQRAILSEFEGLLGELSRPKRRWFGARRLIRGIYLYGSVGAGKTYLVDLFYHQLTIPDKKRFHFHQFMQEIDLELRRLQGKKNPVRHLALALSKTTRLLCLDEFLVRDVADAMILSELLQALFQAGIVLVVAANTAPNALYWNGVHRDRFLPAISLITTHCRVLPITAHHDYRRGRLSSTTPVYWTPVTPDATAAMMQQFTALGMPIDESIELMIQHRLINCIRRSAHAVWFSFEDLCRVPRCQLDYLELAEQFETLFLSDIPVLSERSTGDALLFIHLIDVLYDRGVQLIASAEAAPALLYPKGPLLASFQRTLSRLDEMQSMDYLHRHGHRDLSYLG